MDSTNGVSGLFNVLQLHSTDACPRKKNGFTMEQYAMEAIIIVLPRSNEQPEWQKSNIALITIGDHVLKYTVKDIMKRTMV